MRAAAGMLRSQTGKIHLRLGYLEGENSVLKWPVLAEWLMRQSPTAEADVTKANNRVSTQNSSPCYLLHMMGDPFLQ